MIAEDFGLLLSILLTLGTGLAVLGVTVDIIDSVLS